MPVPTMPALPSPTARDHSWKPPAPMPSSLICGARPCTLTLPSLPKSILGKAALQQLLRLSVWSWLRPWKLEPEMPSSAYGPWRSKRWYQ